MKKFLQKLALFFLSALILFLSVELYISVFPFGKREQDQSKSIQRFESKVDQINILFLGDSRIYYGIDPQFLNSDNITHNFGFAAESIQTTYWKMKYYFDQGQLKNLNKIYVIFDDFMLSSNSRIGLNKRNNYTKYYKYYFSEITENMEVNEKVAFWLRNHVNLIRLKNQLKNIITNNIISYIKSAINKDYRVDEVQDTGNSRRFFYLSSEQFTKYENDLRERAKLKSNDFLPHPEPLNYYQELITISNKNDVELKFVLMPDASILLKNDIHKPEIDIYNNNSVILAKKYFPNIDIINLNTLDIKWEKRHFSDPGHLNSKGAELLSRAIKDFLK